MTDTTQAREALKAIGVPNVDDLTDEQVRSRISILIGALTTLGRSLATMFRLQAEGMKRLLHAFADAIEADHDDPAHALIERLARAEVER